MNDETLDATVENESTGMYWECQHCWWEGPEATIDLEEWVMRCPECDCVIDNRLKKKLGL